ALLEEMLQEDVSITARGVVRRATSPFKHASDITRIPARRELLRKFKEKQGVERGLKERASKQSRANLVRRVARLEAEVETLRAARDLLIVSHKAMLLAVGETGGM